MVGFLWDELAQWKAWMSCSGAVRRLVVEVDKQGTDISFCFYPVLIHLLEMGQVRMEYTFLFLATVTFPVDSVSDESRGGYQWQQMPRTQDLKETPFGGSGSF